MTDPKPEPLQNGIIAAIMPVTENAVPGVCIILGQSNKFTDADGNVLPGIGMTPAKAREIGHALLYFSMMVENGSATVQKPMQMTTSVQ